MPIDDARVCFERIVPIQYVEIARDKALAENPDNASSLEAASVRSKLWKPGRTLRIRFLDGSSVVQMKVEKHAKAWMKYANINFVFIDDPDAEIRISFRENGSWSALGTDALVEEMFPKDGPTMNYGWLTPTSSDRDYSSVVLHEFGHALGLIHEHQNPASAIRWNREAVIASLSGPPNRWDEATIEYNVFKRYTRTRTQFTKFDPKSIMLYAFPKSWTLDGLEFPENSELSKSDKAFIRERYPKSE